MEKLKNQHFSKRTIDKKLNKNDGVWIFRNIKQCIFKKVTYTGACEKELESLTPLKLTYS